MPLTIEDMQPFAPRPKLSLRSSHRRVRLGTSHREVPSAWAPASKDAAPTRAPQGKPKRR